MTRSSFLPLLSVLLVGCFAQAALSPAIHRLAPWTERLSAQQPDDAFASVYRVGDRNLVFIGAIHENQVDSKTFRLIGQAFDHYRFGRVIVEGFPTSRGANPQRLLREAAVATSADGVQPGGETVPALRGAIRQGAQIWGGEPDDLDVKRYAIERGIAEADLLGFYVLRTVPQWLLERQISSATDPRLTALVDNELGRQRQQLAVGDSVLSNAVAWKGWYAKVQGRELDDRFSTEEVGPRVDGVYPTNRIGAIIAEARDAHLHRLMVGQLNEGVSVLVVYGGSHLMIHEPALGKAIGKPCYVGDDLAQSVKPSKIDNEGNRTHVRDCCDCRAGRGGGAVVRGAAATGVSRL